MNCFPFISSRRAQGSWQPENCKLIYSESFRNVNGGIAFHSIVCGVWILALMTQCTSIAHKVTQYNSFFDITSKRSFNNPYEGLRVQPPSGLPHVDQTPLYKCSGKTDLNAFPLLCPFTESRDLRILSRLWSFLPTSLTEYLPYRDIEDHGHRLLHPRNSDFGKSDYELFSHYLVSKCRVHLTWPYLYLSIQLDQLHRQIIPSCVQYLSFHTNQHSSS